MLIRASRAIAVAHTMHYNCTMIVSGTAKCPFSPQGLYTVYRAAWWFKKRTKSQKHGRSRRVRLRGKVHRISFTF